MPLALPYLRTSVLLLLFFCSVLFRTAAADNCDALAQQNAQWQEEIQGVAAVQRAYEQLLKGSLPADTLPVSRFLAPLGVERSRNQIIATLQTQRSALNKELKQHAARAEEGACGELSLLWQSTQLQHLQAQVAGIDLKLRLMSQSATDLRFLFRELKAWQNVHQVMTEVQQTLASVDSGFTPNITSHLQALMVWGDLYQQVLGAWLPFLLAESVATDDVFRVSEQSRGLPRVAKIAEWSQLELALPEESARWIEQLVYARSELVMAISQWRNSVIWDKGWLHLLVSIAHPLDFIEQLGNELVAAPANFWDNLSAPFLKEYRYYQRQNALASLIRKWGFNIFALVISLFVIIKLAEAAPGRVAKIQQSTMQRLEQPAAIRFVSGLFWVLKPNAPWVFVLFTSQIIASMANQQGLLAWIGPIGILYALFRVIRIVFEWLVSRTYSRAGEFVSPAIADKIIHDCHLFAWAIVSCGLVWWLGIGTGGGYLRFIIVLATLAIAWWALRWLLYRHEQALLRFIPSLNLSGEKNGTGSTKGRFARLIRFFTIPLHFIYAHTKDAILSLNHKLLAFDSYRSFSVKLLRARLESKAEEDIEDDAEPDENYSDWVRRAANAEMLFDVADSSRVLEPILHWYKDKTEENVLMLVGESGSGKTTFVDRLSDIWQECPVQYIRFTDKASKPSDVLNCIAEALGREEITDVSELVKLDAESDQRVIVIDDAQNLFLAEVGYFDAYRTLMQCMNAQLENIFWVVVMHAPSWSYLSCVFAREQRVSNVYRMPRWSPQDIRRLILSRHQGGKRRLRYNELLFSAAASSESTSVRGADSRVFNILWEQSGGNPTAAIELWLNAAKVKGRVVEIGVPERPSTAPLSGMKNDLYFVYSAIVVHRRLSTQELMLVTHFAEPIVRHALKQGINLGLIVKEDGRYAVDSLWYGTLSGFLQRKNLLWM